MTRFTPFQPKFGALPNINHIRVEIYTNHGETTKSVMDSLMEDREKRLGYSHLSENDKAKLRRYYTWLESIKQQLHGHRIPTRFKLAYLQRNDLDLTDEELCKVWRNRKSGVSVRKVNNRLHAFNKEHGVHLRPCRPVIPFLLKVLDVHSAPFHHGFVGTGLHDVDGRKSSIHLYAPLDWVSIARSLHSEPVAYKYYDDGYWEPGGAQTFVFEC